jgi:hypothetical protein
MAGTPPRPGSTPGASDADPDENVTVTPGSANWWGGQASVAPAETMPGKVATSPAAKATPAAKRAGPGRPANLPPPPPVMEYERGGLLSNGEPRPSGIIYSAMNLDDLCRVLGLPLPPDWDDVAGVATKIARNADILALMPLGERTAYIDGLIRQTLQGSIHKIFAALLSDERFKNLARSHTSVTRKADSEANQLRAWAIYEALCVSRRALTPLRKTSTLVLMNITLETKWPYGTVADYMRAYPASRHRALVELLANLAGST